MQGICKDVDDRITWGTLYFTCRLAGSPSTSHYAGQKGELAKSFARMRRGGICCYHKVFEMICCCQKVMWHTYGTDHPKSRINNIVRTGCEVGIIKLIVLFSLFNIQIKYWASFYFWIYLWFFNFIYLFKLIRNSNIISVRWCECV